MTVMLVTVNPANIVLIAVIAALAGAGVTGAVRHFRGQGDCCGGGGGTVKAEKKELQNPEILRYIMHIEGMHCENCKAAVERQINRIEGAACEVDLKNKTATVRCDRQIEAETLRRTVAMMDYDVKSITQEAVK